MFPSSARCRRPSLPRLHTLRTRALQINKARNLAPHSHSSPKTARHTELVRHAPGRVPSLGTGAVRAAVSAHLLRRAPSLLAEPTDRHVLLGIAVSQTVRDARAPSPARGRRACSRASPARVPSARPQRAFPARVPNARPQRTFPARVPSARPQRTPRSACGRALTLTQSTSFRITRRNDHREAARVFDRRRRGALGVPGGVLASRDVSPEGGGKSPDAEGAGEKQQAACPENRRAPAVQRPD